jgi:peptidoglycan/LPS O-acetylase OafA/YrhL
MLPIFGLTVLLIIGLIAWVTNRTIKKSLRKKLGRNVKDHEVVSLSAWMKADDKK